MNYILILIGIFLLLPTFLPMFSVDWWWVRVGDFPRIQLIVIYLMAIMLILGFSRSWTAMVVSGILVLCVLYQLSWVYSYLPLAPIQTQKATRTDRERYIRIMMANVLMTNRAAGQFIGVVKKADPDILIIAEPDTWWEAQLRELDDLFSHHTKYPLHNSYGMIFYSKLPVLRSEVKFLMEEDVPSIHSLIKLPSGDVIEVVAVHPRPPRPYSDTDERDAELIVVGKQVKASPYPSIVAGDLNDVGWSPTTALFQKVSGTLDPRRGRGMYNTFHAEYPLLRFPLDHLFHSVEFRLVKITVLDYFGSDHFPLLIELSYEPEHKEEQEAPPLDQEDRKQAEEEIEEAHEDE